jgi:hypothetical protein
VRPIGFSTGALAYSDFNLALRLLKEEPISCVELSALRWSEVEPLLSALSSLDLRRYTYVAFHAPSRFTPDQEPALAALLRRFLPNNWPIVLHPDVISNFELWRDFGRQLAIENMDRRKPGGRTVGELHQVFENLPEAAMCFDIGHARQCDPSMTEAYRILEAYGSRLQQVHVSEVNALSHHDPVSFAARVAFEQVASLIPETVPIIIESRVRGTEVGAEIKRVCDALPVGERMPIANYSPALSA